MNELPGPLVQDAGWDPAVEQWAALRTSARWEKQIAGSLRAAGVPAFLPLIAKSTQYRGKIKLVEVPLFEGYVFCAETHFLGNPAVPQATRKKIAQVIRTANPTSLRGELAEVAAFISRSTLVRERLFGMPGERVRIVHGSLEGLEGKIVRLKPDKRQIVIALALIGSVVEVDVDEALLEKLG
jgi:transcription antitermination factor NusG